MAQLNTNVGGDYNIKVDGNMNLDVRGDYKEIISKTKTSNTTASVLHTGKTFKVLITVLT